MKARAQRLRHQIDQAGMQATNSVACIHSRSVARPFSVKAPGHTTAQAGPAG
ncbi:hypothetical protein [Streptomyces sp. NPDC017964]|uniref:hypothetical protein n=1 Tax=Streptomyces sp. NPDC017964 TaxID=3365022 RepID=UPI0037B3FFDC